MRKCLIALVAVCAITASAEAAPIYVDLGTAAPPGSLGPYAMTAFPNNPTPNGTSVGSVASPTGGSVTFDASRVIAEIGAGWATWSHGYTGDVYHDAGDTSLTMGLPTGTAAFYFYAEPNPFAVFTFTVTADDGSSTVAIQPIDGLAGARGFGFYSLGAAISSITVSSTVDFAVGEFGIARVPEPASMLLLGSGIAGLAARARRRRRSA